MRISRQNSSGVMKLLLAVSLMAGVAGANKAEARKTMRCKTQKTDGLREIGAIIGLLAGAQNGNDLGDAIGGALAGFVVGAIAEELSETEVCEVKRIHHRELNRPFRNSRHDWGDRNRRSGEIHYHSQGWWNGTYCRDYTHVYYNGRNMVRKEGRYCESRNGWSHYEGTTVTRNGLGSHHRWGRGPRLR